MEILTLTILACIIGLLIFWALQKRNDRTPPGPTGLPIVGYLPFITSKPHLEFSRLEKKYGPVFSLKLGSENVIILNDFQSSRDAFLQDAFMGRPPNSAFKANKETDRTQAINGMPWRDQRRFSLRLLRDLGFGKSKLDEMIREELDEVLEHFSESKGQPMFVRPILAPSMSNNIASLIYGRRMKYDDPDRIFLDRVINESAAEAGAAAWQFFFPWVRKVFEFFQFGKEGRMDYLLRKMKEFARKEIAKHEETFDEDNIRDYIDGYLLEIRKNKDPAFCKPVLEDLSGAFFGGGSETVRVTIEWLLLTMATYQDIQAKVHAEIDNIIGQNRPPSWNDHLQMPYTEATIMEIMRWRCAIPLNLPRYTLWETELNGYVIPKGCTVIANLWAILHNPKYWGPDAEIFRPERFLADDEKTLIKTEYFVPFSVGKRSCPGEPFARSEVFMYFVGIFQKFKVSLPEGAVPDFEGVLGLTIYDTGGNTPHGPTGLPIIGYYFFLSSRPYIDLQNLGKIYGPIFSLQLGSQRCIVLEDYQLTKDAFTQETFLERSPENLCDHKIATREIGQFNGFSWKEQRRFSLQMLKNLEFGTIHLEAVIKEEIRDLLGQFAKSDDQPIQVRSVLSSSIFNNIASLVFGKRFKYDDPVRKMMEESLIDESAVAGLLDWQIFFPRLAKVAKFFKPESEGKKAQLSKDVNDYILKEIAEHEKTLDPNNPRDYIDGYLIEIEKRNDSALCKEVLEDMVGAFFGACCETVLLTVEWLVLTMATHQDVQIKVQQEIDDVIGTERLPSWADHNKMPYTEATIMELMRWRTIIPIDILTHTLQDTELDGYFIPKDSHVLANVWSVHHNPEYWGEDIKTFRPERFLTEDRKEVTRPEYFIPFDERACPNQSYAKTEIFLYFTSILQKFNITLPEGTKPDVNGQLDIGLDTKSHAKFGKKYGGVFSLQLGSQYCIILDDYQSIKDAFAQDAFLGRPPENPFDLKKATLETGAFNGLPWKEQRRFSLQILKDLGFGKSNLEDMMKEEIRDLLDHLAKYNGEPMQLRPVLSPSMSNNIASLMYGKRLKYDDPVRMMLDKALIEGAAAAGQVSWQLFFPWLARLVKFFKLGSEGKLARITKDVNEYTLKEISEHERTLDPNNPRDYIDGYLMEIKKRNDPAFCKEVLEDMVGAFFGAGSETVRLTLEWLVLTTATYQDVQKKVQQEIDDVIGTERLPSWTDHSKMPYTEATIMEIMRWRTIIPINVLRYTLWDTELNGFFIPKDAYVLANLWSIHHNPKYWGKDVDVFRPERFLTEDGNEVVRPEYFIPFSVGKRSCPGESYAKIEVFLYFTSILQKFHISLPEGAKPDFDGQLGIGLMPKPFEVCLTKRF
ncbi:Cytochrome P450 2U1 like protein [Argiope bruennichi]|uniref:Cytochrome P450 2U1 n=1 Tax=Argiope bruennichi TaxID=94029 RepID=A0A8T0FN70_ARGBR|nr:Cytochrome P450 2U1 like protein [Argiope bruennichi]